MTMTSQPWHSWLSINLNPTMIILKLDWPSKLKIQVLRVLLRKLLMLLIKFKTLLKISVKPIPKKELTVKILSMSKISKLVLNTSLPENNSLSKVCIYLIFIDFVVTHDVTIQVDNTDKIGELGDKLLKLSNTKIDSFDWESDEEEDDE